MTHAPKNMQEPCDTCAGYGCPDCTPAPRPGPAKGQFCHEHFSWLCQAGQGQCQRTDHQEAPGQGEDPYGEAFDLFEEIRAERAVKANDPPERAA